MAEELPATETSKVQVLVRDYIRRVELGEAPDVAEYERQLTTELERRELLDLVKTLGEVDAALPARIEIGTLVSGRYRVEAELGAGGMGRVLLAHDEKNDRAVALKVLHVSGSELESAALLRRERRALVRLHHPNIVTFLDADRWRDSFYLVMERVDGISLGEVIQALRSRADGDGRVDRHGAGLLVEILGRAAQSGRPDLLRGRSYFEAVAAIVAACASALECAHAANVVHRDIKPANVLLTGGGNPVLLDFGLAGLLDATRGPLTSGLVGTPNYIAPEQAKSWRTGADPRTDIYQLGAMLYELLTLERPWQNEPRELVIAAIRERQVPRARERRPEIPFELDSICARAMERDPAERYQTAMALSRDLEGYLSRKALPEAARASAPFGLRLQYLLRRHALPMAAVATLMLGAGATLWLRGGEVRPELLDLLLPADGVVIAEASGRQVLYALVVSTDADGKSRVTPAYLRRSGAGDSKRTVPRFGLELDRGTHALEIVAPAAKTSGRRVLKILNWEAPSSLCEDSWSALQEEVEASGRDLPVAAARKILESLGVARGAQSGSNRPTPLAIDELLAGTTSDARSSVAGRLRLTQR